MDYLGNLTEMGQLHEWGWGPGGWRHESGHLLAKVQRRGEKSPFEHSRLASVPKSSFKEEFFKNNFIKCQPCDILNWLNKSECYYSFCFTTFLKLSFCFLLRMQRSANTFSKDPSSACILGSEVHMILVSFSFSQPFKNIKGIFSS